MEGKHSPGLRFIEIFLGTHNWDQFLPGLEAGSTWYTKEENIRIFLDEVEAYAIGHPESVAVGAWHPDQPGSAVPSCALRQEEAAFQ